MTRDLSDAREQNILPLSRDRTRQKTLPKSHYATKPPGDSKRSCSQSSSTTGTDGQGA